MNESPPSQRPSRQRWLYVVLALLFLAMPLLTYLSYLNARHQAEALIARIPARYYPLGGRLALQNFMTNEWQPSWMFSYDLADGGAVGPLQIQVSFFGGIFATNPDQLLERYPPSN